MIEVRTSERAAFKRCHQRWWWGIVEGLAARRAKNPLWFGQAWHIAMAEWYRPGYERGPHPAVTFEEVLEGSRSIRVPSDDPDLEGEYVDALQLGIAMANHYVKTYGQDEDWNVVATEQTFELWLPRLGATRRTRDIRYLGTFDGVYKDRKTKRCWLMEHKTAAGINIDHLPLDNQAGSYWAVANRILRTSGVLGPGEEIAGIMYNFARKKELDSRPQNSEGFYTIKPVKEDYYAAFREAGIPYEEWGKIKLADLPAFARKNELRVLGKVSKQQPAPYFLRHPVYRSHAERAAVFRSIKKDAWHMDQARRTAETGYPITKNPTKDCSWDCDFYRMCMLHEQAQLDDVEDYKASMYVHRDPYEDHRDVRKSA